MPTVSGIQTLCNGQTITLTAESGYTNYVWSTSATGPSIDVNTPGQYQVTVTCANGNTAFANVNVPGFTTGVQVAGNSTICAGQCVNLSVQLLNGTNGPYTIVFSLSTGGTQSFTVNPSGGGPFTFINVCPTQTTTYTIQSVTNSQSCLAFINPNIQSATITVGGGGGGLSITGPDFLCTGSSVTLVANPNTYQNYQWSNNSSGPTTTITQPGTYTVTATIAPGCTATATKTVQASSIIPPVITGGATLCTGSSLTLTANGTGYTAYNWSNNATTNSIAISQPGTYTVTVTNAQGCTGTATQLIVGAPLPSVTFTVANPNVCAGACTTVTATFSGTAPFTLTYTSPAGGATQSFSGNSGTFQVCAPANASPGSLVLQATSLTDAGCTCD